MVSDRFLEVELLKKEKKHTRSGALLEVEMYKKCMPLWRAAHFQVKMVKTPNARMTFGRSRHDHNNYSYKYHYNYKHNYHYPIQLQLKLQRTLKRQLYCVTLHKLQYATTTYSYNNYYTTLHYTVRYTNYTIYATLH